MCRSIQIAESQTSDVLIRPVGSCMMHSSMTLSILIIRDPTFFDFKFYHLYRPAPFNVASTTCQLPQAQTKTWHLKECTHDIQWASKTSVAYRLQCHIVSPCGTLVPVRQWRWIWASWMSPSKGDTLQTCRTALGQLIAFQTARTTGFSRTTWGARPSISKYTRKSDFAWLRWKFCLNVESEILSTLTAGRCGSWYLLEGLWPPTFGVHLGVLIVGPRI